MVKQNNQTKSEYLESLAQNVPNTNETKSQHLERLKQQKEEEQTTNQQLPGSVEELLSNTIPKSKDKPTDSYDSQNRKMSKISGNKGFMAASMLGAFARSIPFLDNTAGALLQGSSKSFSSVRNKVKGQSRKKYEKELGAVGKADQLGRSISAAGRLTYGANMLSMLGSAVTGIGKDSISPTRSAMGMISQTLGPLGMGALALPGIVGGIGAGMKMKKIRPQKRPPEQIESESSKAKNLDSYYKKIISTNDQIQPFDQLQYMLMSYIEAHTSVIPSIHSMIEETIDKENKAGKGLGELDPLDVKSDSIFTKLENLTSTIDSKYNPVSQVMDLIFGGKTPKQVVDDIESGKKKDYSKLEKEKIKNIGLDKSQYRLITTSSGSLIAGANSYQEKILGLTAGQYDLFRLIAQESITIRKHGFGISHNKFSGPVEGKGFLSKVISGIDTVAQSIPVLAAGYNAVKGLIQFGQKSSDVIKGIFSGGMNAIFGKKFLEFQKKENVDKELGFDKTIQEKVNDYLSEGLPTQLEKIRALSANQLEAIQNIFDATKSQYELLYGYYTGKTTQFQYEKKLGDDVTQERVWDIVEKRMLTGEAFEKAQDKREKQRQFKREQAFGSSLYGILQTDILNLGETLEDKMNRSMKPLNQVSDKFDDLVGIKREKTETTKRFITTERDIETGLTDYDIERKKDIRTAIKGDKNVKDFAKEAEHQKDNLNVSSPISSGIGLLSGGAMLAGLGPVGLAALGLSPIIKMGLDTKRDANINQAIFDEIGDTSRFYGRDVESIKSEIEKRKVSHQDRQTTLPNFSNIIGSSKEIYQLLKRRLPNIATNIGSFVSQFNIFKDQLFKKLDKSFLFFNDFKTSIVTKFDMILSKMDGVLLSLRNINSSVGVLTSNNNLQLNNIAELLKFHIPDNYNDSTSFNSIASFKGGKIHPLTPTLVGEGKGSNISNTAEMIVGNNVISTDQTQAFLKDNKINTVSQFKSQVKGKALAEGTPNNVISISNKLEEDKREKEKLEEQLEQKKQTKLLNSLVIGFKEEWKKEDKERKKKDGGFFSNLFSKLAGLATGTLPLLGILGGVGAIGASILSGGSIGGKAAMSFVGNLFSRFVGVLEKVIVKSKLLPELISKGFAKTGSITAKMARPFKGLITKIISTIPEQTSKFISGLIPKISTGVSESVAKFGATKGAGWISKIGPKVLKTLGWAGKGLKFIAKKVPFLGAFIGGYLALERAAKGDYLGAVGELTSGIVSIFPGIGTAVSIGIDTLLVLKDMKAKKEESEGNVNTKKELEKVKENIFARAKRWPIISTFYHLGGAFKKLFTGDFGGFFKELGLSALNTIIPGFDIIAKLMSDTKEERDDVKSDKTGANLKKLRESVIYRLKTTPLIGSFVSLGSSLWNFLTLDFKQGFKDLAHAGLSFPGVGLLMSLFEDDEELEKVKVEKKTFNDIIKGLLVKLKDKFANAISKMPVIGGWVANNIFGSNFKDELDEKSNVSSKDIYKRLKDQGTIDRNLFGSDTIEEDKQLSNLSQQELNELIKTDRFKNKELEKIKTELAKQKEKNTKKTITKDDLKIPAFSEGGELPPGVSIIGEGKSGPISKSAEFVHTDRTGKSTVIPQDKSQEILKDKNITRDNLDQKSTIISQDNSQEILKDKNIENTIDKVKESKFSSGGYWMNLFEKTIDQIFNFAGIDNFSTNFISRFKIPLTKEKQKEFNKYKDQFISEGLPEKKAIKKAINKLSEENPEYIDSYSEILKKNIKNKSTISNNDFQIDVDNLSSLITTRNSMKEFISLQNKGIKSKSINQTTSNKDIFNNWKNELTYDGNKFYELNKTINDKYNHHLLLNLLKTEFKNREWLSDSPDMKSRDYALILNDVNKNWKRQNLDLPEKINKQEINMIDRFRSEDENFKYIVRNRYPLLMDKADRYNELYLEFLQSKKENIPHQEALKVLREEDPKYFERYENTLRDEIGILDTNKYGIIQDVKQERAEKRAVEKFIESEYLKKINDKPNDVQYSPIQIDKNKTIERKDLEKKNVKLTDAEKKVLTENHNKINTLTTSQVQSFNNKIDNSTSEHIDSNGHKTHDRIANIIRTGVDNIESNRLNNDNIDDLIQKHIIFHEGVVLKKYVDTEGYPTIGIGHKIKNNEEFPSKISYDKAISLFEDDYDKHKRETQKLSVYSKLDPIRKGALTDMVYNMGYGTVKNFKNMLNALSNKDYDKAQEEALDSKWATQVGNRANKISKLLKTGDPKWFSSGEPQVIAKTGAYYTGEGTGSLRAELHPREMVINDTQFDTFLKNMADSISEHIKSLSNTKDYKTSKIINRATEVNRIEEDNKIQELEMEKNRQNTKTDVEQKAPIYIDNSSTNTGQNVLATKQDDKKPAAGEFTEIDSSLDRLVLNLFDKTQILTRQIEGYVFNNEQPLSIY